MIRTISQSAKKARFIVKGARFRKRTSTKPRFITCTGKTDGVGAQTHAVLSTLAFAEQLGIQYVHTPYLELEHNIGNEKLWEQYFSIGLDQRSIEDYLPNLRRKKFHLEDKWQFDPQHLYEIEHCHAFTNLFPESFNPIMQSLKTRRSLDYDTLNNSGLYNSGVLKVACHIRRGDVASHGHNAFRYTSSDYVIGALTRLIRVLTAAGVSYELNIFSQGSEEDFKDFVAMGAKLFLNHCLFETMSRLITADVLMTSKSSLSYVAALYSEGIVLYEPFWHPPLNSWIVLSRNGSFNRNRFEQKLNVQLV